MKKQEIKSKLLEELIREEYLYFPDIEHFFQKQNYDFKGKNDLFLVNDDGSTNYSQVVWGHWSLEAIEIVTEIVTESKGKIGFRCFTNPVEILESGGAYDLPVSKDFNRTYKEPHWAPTCMQFVEIRKDF